MATLKKALNYIHNAEGNATPISLITDYAPVGHILYTEVQGLGFVKGTEDGNLILTEKGEQKREELNDGN